MFVRGLSAFWRALRANWVSAIGIWCMAGLIVWGYYAGSCVRVAADDVLFLRGRLGIVYPILSMTLFGALLPALTQFCFRPTERRIALRRLPWLIPFWMYKGVEVDLFYRLQGHLFGDNPTFWGVVGKVCVDQFVYNPVFGGITLVLFYRWLAIRMGELPATEKPIPQGWYGRLVVPLLVATWALWIPAVSFVYMMPTALQLPLANLILWLWSLMLIFMAKDEGRQA